MPEAVRTYNCIIVDDNEIDRLSTQVQVNKYPFLQLSGVFDNPAKAIDFLSNNKVDVLFLDIDMPGISGLDLRRQMGKEQVCLFITSFPDYAVESFELAALDFMLKPINRDRFAQAMERLQAYLEIQHKADLFESSLGADTIFIKDGHSQQKIKLHDVLYLEALKDYTRVVTADKKYFVHSVLGNLLLDQNFKTFIRIHRSYAVQKHFITKITAQEVHLANVQLPIGRTYKSALEEITGN